MQDRADRPDWVKIVDFGIASLIDITQQKRLTRVGVVIGTPEYMATEQFVGKPLDGRTDIYSLGVLLFEMFAGTVPYDAVAYDVLMAKHLMEAPPSISKFRNDVAEGSQFDLIVKKCLAKNPDDRFQNVAGLKRSIETALGYPPG